MVSARQVMRNAESLEEQRLLNVVDEMAIAAGVAVPSVWVMDKEEGINAFAAGYSPNQAVIVVTHGTLTKLNREELQGVIGHEFSHILNGDMRLNVRLIGILAGIVVVGEAGLVVIRLGAEANDSGAIAFILLGALIAAVGYIGVFFGRMIKAAVSRQREFLADASSVQFTRNPDGFGQRAGKNPPRRRYRGRQCLRRRDEPHVLQPGHQPQNFPGSCSPPIHRSTNVWRASPGAGPEPLQRIRECRAGASANRPNRPMPASRGGRLPRCSAAGSRRRQYRARDAGPGGQRHPAARGACGAATGRDAGFAAAVAEFPGRRPLPPCIAYLISPDAAVSVPFSFARWPRPATAR